MHAHRSREVLLSKDEDGTPGSAVAVAESLTNQVVSQIFPISYMGSKNIRVKVKVSAITVAAAIDFKLQHIDDAVSGTWLSQSKSAVSLTATGDKYLTFNVEVAGDQADLPLMPHGRIVVTTGAGDSVSISSIKVMQGD